MPLGVPGEQVWRVGGLAVANPRSTFESEETDDGAVSLFMERAGEASTRFDPDAPGVRDTVRRICRWLDGMPLAIELAAARVPVLGVGQIADRLERDGSVLRHPSRTAPERHRTLEAMLEWSHRLLEEDEQRLFRRLGAFRGTFSLAAAGRRRAPATRVDRTRAGSLRRGPDPARAEPRDLGRAR